MANASRDNNNVPTLLGVLNTDGETIVPIKVNASANGLLVHDDQVGDDYGPVDAPRDDNYVPALIAVSSVDGVTPVVVYADSDGRLLIDSN